MWDLGCGCRRGWPLGWRLRVVLGCEWLRVRRSGRWIGRNFLGVFRGFLRRRRAVENGQESASSRDVDNDLVIVISRCEIPSRIWRDCGTSRLAEFQYPVCDSVMVFEKDEREHKRRRNQEV